MRSSPFIPRAIWKPARPNAIAADSTVIASTGVVGRRSGTAGADVARNGGSTVINSRSGTNMAPGPPTLDTSEPRRSSSVTVR